MIFGIETTKNNPRHLKWYKLIRYNHIYQNILKSVKNESKRKAGKSSCKGLIMRIINNFVAEQVTNVFFWLCVHIRVGWRYV